MNIAGTTDLRLVARRVYLRDLNRSQRSAVERSAPMVRKVSGRPALVRASSARGDSQGFRYLPSQVGNRSAALAPADWLEGASGALLGESQPNISTSIASTSIATVLPQSFQSILQHSLPKANLRVLEEIVTTTALPSLWSLANQHIRQIIAGAAIATVLISGLQMKAVAVRPNINSLAQAIQPNVIEVEAPVVQIPVRSYPMASRQSLGQAPRSLRMASLEINQVVEPLIAPSGQLSLPGSFKRLGWLMAADGATVLTGSRNDGPGAAFRKLDEAIVGSQIQLLAADGKLQVYKVVDVKQVAQPPTTDQLRGGSSRLYLLALGSGWANNQTTAVLLTAEKVN